MLSKYCVAFIHHKNFRSSCHQMVVIWNMTWFCLYITMFYKQNFLQRTNLLLWIWQHGCCTLFVSHQQVITLSKTDRGNIFWVSNLELGSMESYSHMQASAKGMRCHAWYSLYIHMCVFHFLLLLVGYKDVGYNFFF